MLVSKDHWSESPSISEKYQKRQAIFNHVATVHWHNTNFLVIYVLIHSEFLEKTASQRICSIRRERSVLCDANHNRAVQHYLISPLTHIINTWLLLAWMSNQQSYGHMALANKCWWGREALHGDEEPISLSQEWLAYLYYLVHLWTLMMDERWMGKHSG